MNCPKCGTEINPAAEMAKERARQRTRAQRVQQAKNAIAVRWAKKKNLPTVK